MELAITFIIFIAAMITMLITGHSMVWALLVGLLLFTFLGLKYLKYGNKDSVGEFTSYSYGQGLKELVRCSWGSIRESLIVIEVMCIIGFITAAWRMSGTITVFVYYGMKIIVPPLFLIITFVLSCLLSYALGTSFGVAGTVGVIFMALARSGGVDPIITAGVIMSGIYFGDRGSPVSSSANVVAGVTKTDILTNVRLMFKVGLLPFALTTAAYVVLSILNPINHVDGEIIHAFESQFTLSPWVFLPAALMVALPLCRVGIITSISISTISSVVIAWAVEKVALVEIVKTLLFGYKSSGTGLSSILDGGGLLSMAEIVIILIISCAFSGIFNRTNMLDGLQGIVEKSCSKLGRFITTLIVSALLGIVFCNQTIATLMCKDILEKPYANTGGTNQELAIDMENTVILIVALIPWCIASSVPLSFMGVGIEALPWSIYIYLTPICYIFTKKIWFSN
ncbi:MAG: Na+/H+ antiporter NhaC family protein [Bacillota bacterium]|nr:Na+/H+ antiporter NhaC family protein [Bacillota bacterium]